MKARFVPVKQWQAGEALLRARAVTADAIKAAHCAAVYRARKALFRRAMGRTGWIACLLVFPAVAFSAEYILSPSVTLQSGYDDNFRLTEDDEDQVYINQVVAEVALSRLTETLELTGLARFDYVTYSGDDEGLDEEDNELLNLSLLNKVSERSRLGFDALYKRDTLLRTANVFNDPGDVGFEPDVDVDDNLVNQEVRRDRLDLNPSYSYALTELTDVKLSYRFTDVSHDDGEQVNVVDYELHIVGLSLQNRLTPTDVLTTTLEGSSFEADNDREYENVSLETGVNHAFSETLSGGFTIGARQTEYDTPQEGSSDDSGLLASLTLTRLTEVTSYNARLQRILAPSSSGDQVQADRLLFNVARELSPTTQFSMRAEYFNIESLQSEDDMSSRDREYLTIEPVLSWAFAPEWSLGLSYRYRNGEREGEGSEVDGQSNAIFVSLNWARPIVLEQDL